MKWLLRLAVVLFAAAWLTSPATVHAADYYWDNPLSGSYHDTNNWSPSGYVPVDPGDVAIINNGGTAEIASDVGDSILGGVGTLHVGNTTGEGHVLQTAGNVYVDNYFYVGNGSSAPTDLPTYTMQGGSLTLRDTGAYPWGFRIGIGCAATMSVTGSDPITPTAVVVNDQALVGYAAGSDGTLEMSGESTASFNRGLWAGYSGAEGNVAKGTVNLSGNATVTASYGSLGCYDYSHGEMNISGNAKFTAAGWFNLGDTGGVSGEGSITVKDNGILETYDIRVGIYAAGNGTVTVGGTAGTSKWDSNGGVVVGWINGTGEIVANTNSLINMNSYLQVGVDGGTGNAVVNSGGTLNLNSWTRVGTGENSSGTAVVNSGGSMNVLGWLGVGVGVNSTGELTLHDGGTIDVADANGWISFGETGSVGVFTMDGGQFTFGTDSGISLGYYHNTSANWNQTGGTFTSGSAMEVGRYGGVGTATFAGTAQATLPAFRVGVNWGDNGTDLGVGEVVVDGNAQVTVTGVGTYGGEENNFANTITLAHGGGDGTWTQNGGTTTCANAVVVSEYDYWDETDITPGVGVVNLNGGTFACPGMMVRANSDVVTGTAGTVNLNGGTLKATGDSSDFFIVDDPGITPTATLTLKVQAGGAVIDTDTYNVTISDPLTEDAGSTGGGLTKLGGGTLTLTGSGHSYTGDTVVSAGTLSTTDAAMMDDDANLWIALGAVMDLDFTGTDTIAKLYLGGSAQATGTWGATGSGAAHVDDVHFSGLGMVLVTQSAVQIPGDADLNGVVDEDDAVRLAENWGVQTGATWEMGDFNGDFKVDAADAAVLAANWGATAGGGEEAPVPEPGMMALLVGLGLALVARRTRR